MKKIKEKIKNHKIVKHVKKNKVIKYINSNEILSFILEILFIFIFVKFIFLPSINFIFQTDFPIVIVMSNSMHHKPTQSEGSYMLCGNYYVTKPTTTNFYGWWYYCKDWYDKNNITKEEFENYKFKNGFSKGDILLVTGINPKNLKKGDVIVYQTMIRAEPIIHRLVKIENKNNELIFQTKGDNNLKTFEGLDTNIKEEKIYGKAYFKIPYLGYIKIFIYETFLKLIK